MEGRLFLDAVGEGRSGVLKLLVRKLQRRTLALVVFRYAALALDLGLDAADRV